MRTNDWSEIHIIVQEAREVAEKMVRAEYCQEAGKFLAGLIDAQALARKPPEMDLSNPRQVSAWAATVSEVRSEQDVPTFEVCLLPHRNRVYGMVFTNRDEYRRFWLSLSSVEPWPYWNNTDRPDDLTDRQWRNRGKVWDAILAGHGIPGMLGFTAKIVRESWPFARLDEVLRHVPNLATRARTLAVDRLFKKRHRRIDASNVAGAFMDMKSWTKTPKGKQAIRAETDRIKARLPRRITRQLAIDTMVVLPDREKS